MAWYENPAITYPQLPALTPHELDTFLALPLIAKLASHNEDGSIHLVALFFKYVDGDILLGTQAMTHKVENVNRDPNVTVLIDQSERPFKGVIIYGKASLEYEDVIAKRAAIFETYMPPENAAGFAEALANRWDPVIIRVKPDHIISYDYAKG